MTKQTKSANYSPESIALITAKYSAGESLEAISAATGKTIASIRAKLASLGVYKPKEKSTGKKAGETKETIVAEIAAMVTGDKGALESLKASTIADLRLIRKFLVDMAREDEGLEPLPEGLSWKVE